MKNWRTTLLGAISGITLILKGIATQDHSLALSGVSMVVMGYFSKDHAISGTGK